MNNNIFRIVVYTIGLYLLFINNSIRINIVGLIILIAHLYKDINNLTEWPHYTEYIGLLLGIILIVEGCKINNYIIIICGVLKFIAHTRQLIFKDNRYYY